MGQKEQRVIIGEGGLDQVVPKYWHCQEGADNKVILKKFKNNFLNKLQYLSHIRVRLPEHEHEEIACTW